MVPNLKITCHFPQMTLPSKGHISDVGFDLTAMELTKTYENGVFLFDTGISVHIDDGYYIEVVPRSSMSKTNFMLANSVGVIDPDYRGHVFCALRYVGYPIPPMKKTIKHLFCFLSYIGCLPTKQSQYEKQAREEADSLIGTRIAQMVIRKQETCSPILVDDLDRTTRGAGGFGSTGK